jgi:membrane fusion protein (multidrug efflux system)
MVEERMLELERAAGDRWLVTSGLAAGDQVIVDGLQRVRAGMAVRAVPATGGTAPDSASSGDPARGSER